MLRQSILDTAQKHGAFNIRIFGSVVRGDAQDGSDVDFLVDMEQDRSLMDLGGLLRDLQDLLGCDVDIVEPEGLHWYVKDRVLEESVSL